LSGTGQAGDRAVEHRARLGSLRELLDARGEVAAVLASRPNFAWLTAGGTGHVLQSSESAIAALIVTRDEAVAITQNIEAARLAEEELAGLDIEVAAVPWWEPGAIEAEARRRVPAGRRPARDADLEPELGRIRSVLSAFDRERLAILGRDARDAMDASLADVRPGTSEESLVADLLGRLPGSRAPVLLAAADERIARYRHPLPGPSPIRARVMLVLVAERWGLHVALTRTRELEPPAADLASRLEAVAHVQAAMHAATRPGATFGGVLDAARAGYADAGFPDEWRDHHQGGSIGYQARERIAVPSDSAVVEPGMAFAWNPSIAGVKAEDTIVLDGGVARPVTTA
jgi:Xaa-Pro dipeptidase